ncbi:MAG: hypothetical protein EKK31_11830 [Hyphomicrobiales bacterium]|nr:MAG: hypothetical protein EKK31_11830 [Hyphomicrobiales bacterium]
MPYFSNEEIKSRTSSYEPAQILENGSVRGPRCCGAPMADDGGCSEGCCDDYRCETCGHTVRIEWPD